MKQRKVYTVVCALLIAAAMVISTPVSAQGLIGVTITSCFDNIPSCPGDQHWDNDTAVVGPGVEFTGIGLDIANDQWTADFSGPTGSRLTISYTGGVVGGYSVGQGVYKFLFEGLDFADGAAITNVTVDPDSNLPMNNGTPPTFTANSILVTLDTFLLFTSSKSLILDIVTVAPVNDVSIDIKPGSDPNSINVCNMGGLPVAIFSTATFDATDLDPESLVIAGAGIRFVGKTERPLISFKDVDGDGLIDAVVQFVTFDLALVVGDSTATLTGTTFGGVEFEGMDAVRIVKDGC